MIPIQDLLHRIQWDPEFGKADFEIGYFDRVAREIVRVPFRHVRFEKGEHFALEAVEENGSIHAVPLHRVRQVWRNGKLIWQRAPPPDRR
ncbi:MAG TPA: DUF504 domain-containing protein [Burkholderiales bacterium]|nr:DUF504 domain-containing protein [Burkholderiales bacterium]